MRDKNILIRVSEEEYDKIKGMAAREGVGVSEYLRRKALGDESPQPTLDVTASVSTKKMPKICPRHHGSPLSCGCYT